VDCVADGVSCTINAVTVSECPCIGEFTVDLAEEED
jgi:hypothetical protein